MSLLTRLDDDLKKALKHSDKLKLSVLRLIKSALQNKQIEKRRDLTDDEILSLFSSMAKQRRESIEQFSMGGREDLASKMPRLKGTADGRMVNSKVREQLHSLRK
jgi:uncharacterized protein YqeY